MQTQEDHSNPILALNVDSLKVDLVVIQNTCSEKEDSNSETASSKSVKESSLDSATKDQLDKDDFQEDGSMEVFWVINRQFQKFIDSQFTLDYDSQMTDKYFVEYIGIEVKHFRDTLLQHMGNVKKSVAERTKSSKTVRNDTDADDADIRPIYDEEPMAEVQLTAECNIFAIGQQHTEQPEIINEGRVDQYPEQRQVKSPMLDSSPDNQTTDYSKQSLESENILLPKDHCPISKKIFQELKSH
ncbi:hypothetical protein Tco_0246283 [Tanacetum coccineum]